MKYSCFSTPPSDFSPFVEVSSCYAEFEGRILLLLRQSGRPYENMWGVPAGKIERNESPLDSLLREVYEEVGVKLVPEKVVTIGKLYFRIPKGDYIYHMYLHHFDELPEITLAPDEAQNAKWVTVQEAYCMQLMPGAFDALQAYVKFKEIE